MLSDFSLSTNQRYILTFNSSFVKAMPIMIVLYILVFIMRNYPRLYRSLNRITSEITIFILGNTYDNVYGNFFEEIDDMFKIRKVRNNVIRERK